MRNPFKRRREISVAEIDRHRGAIIALWAGIESSIDKTNHYAWLYSDKQALKFVPIGLDRKIETFKRVNRDLLPFESLKSSAAELLDWLERRKGDRHWMAHGYLNPWDSTDGSWSFVKHEFLKDGSIKDLHRTFTREEIVTIRDDLCELAVAFSIYGHALAEQIEKHPPNNKGSKSA